MTAERVFTVAQKEFTDQITGWRFLVILALFLAIALVGTYSGVVSTRENWIDTRSNWPRWITRMTDRPG